MGCTCNTVLWVWISLGDIDLCCSISEELFSVFGVEEVDVLPIGEEGKDGEGTFFRYVLSDKVNASNAYCPEHFLIPLLSSEFENWEELRELFQLLLMLNKSVFGSAIKSSLYLCMLCRFLNAIAAAAAEEPLPSFKQNHGHVDIRFSDPNKGEPGTEPEISNIGFPYGETLETLLLNAKREWLKGASSKCFCEIRFIVEVEGELPLVNDSLKVKVNETQCTFEKIDVH